MGRFTLSRRTVLRGLGGAAVALPPLEIMARGRARAAASSVPNRFLMAYGGVSLGGLRMPIEKNLVIPKTAGPDWTPSRGLAPIGEATYAGNVRGNVKSDVGVVTGLKIPWGSPIPPAGRSSTAGFHTTTLRPQISGERMVGDTENTIQYDPEGSSADQIVANAVRGQTPLPSINLRVQPSAYYNGYLDDTISYINGRPNGSTASLRSAYNTLFSAGGNVNGRTFDVAAYIDRRKSILDTITEKSSRLMARLGGDDRKRVEQYYTQIRDLEKTLEGIKAKSGTMACTPMSPPTDPPIADGYTTGHTDPSVDPYTPNLGWSDEELRAQVMVDFLHLAFSCDLTRSAILQLTMAQSYMNAWFLTTKPARYDLHSVGHGYRDPDVSEDQNNEQIADIVAWHVRHFSRLAAKLRDTVEVDGTRVLDHCAMFMLWEGGHGDTGDPTRGSDSHSTENMMAVVAGGAGGLKSGQHIHFNNDRHPAQVVLTHMNAVGVSVGQPLGEIAEPLPELFR